MSISPADASDQIAAGRLRLRRDCEYRRVEERLSFALRDRRLEFRPKNSAHLLEWSDVVESLTRNGIPQATLNETSYSAASSRFIQHLHSNGLILEDSIEADQRGDVRFVLARMKSVLVDYEHCALRSSLNEYLNGEGADPRVMMGYLIEHYHVTATAYDGLLPALAHSSGRFQAIMERMVMEEFGHDLILAQGVHAFGVSASDLPGLAPLPYTAALTLRLGQAAKKDGVLFALMVFIFEQDVDQAQLYDLLTLNGAPLQAINALREHEKINRDGKHEHVCAELLSTYGRVSPDDERRYNRELWIVEKMMARYHSDLIDFYSRSSGSPLRTDSAMSEYGSAAADIHILERFRAVRLAVNEFQVADRFVAVVPRALAAIYSGTQERTARRAIADAIVQIRNASAAVDRGDGDYPRYLAERMISDFLEQLPERHPTAVLSCIAQYASYLMAATSSDALQQVLETIHAAVDAASAALKPIAPEEKILTFRFTELLSVLLAEVEHDDVLGEPPVLSTSI